MTDLQPIRIRNILAAIDGSDHAEKAGMFAVDLAAKYESRLVLLHVASYHGRELGLASHTIAVGPIMPDERVEHLKKKARESLERIGSIARERNIANRREMLETQDSVVETIVDFAEKESVQIIVAGANGLGSYDPYATGSVSSRLIGKSRCSVLIVR